MHKVYEAYNINMHDDDDQNENQQHSLLPSAIQNGGGRGITSMNPFFSNDVYFVK